MEQSLSDIYRKYLSQDVKFEIVKNIGTRELSLINRKEGNLHIRYLIGDSVETLDYRISRFNILGRPRNFYMSCAIHSKIPRISDDLRTRKLTHEYKNFNENYLDTCIGFDFLFDLDGKHGDDYYGEAKIIIKVLEEYKVPYYILTSSLQGLHIIIPSEYLPKKSVKDIVNDIANKILFNFRGIYELKSLDIDIMDLKKLRKVPYSPVIDSSVCIPLSPEQFENYVPNDYIIENVMKNIKIKGRGLLIRTYGLSESQLQSNVLKFWKDFFQ